VPINVVPVHTHSRRILDLVLARIIKPTSKQDSLWVLAEVGIEPVSYRSLTRRLPLFAKDTIGQALSAACAAHVRLPTRSVCAHTPFTMIAAAFVSANGAKVCSPMEPMSGRGGLGGHGRSPGATRH
jgi:hypothetical protein